MRQIRKNKVKCLWLILAVSTFVTLGCSQMIQLEAIPEKSQMIQLEAIREKQCEERAKNLVPTKLTGISEGEDLWGVFISNWSNGNEVKTVNFRGFTKGFLPGENINYYYTRTQKHSEEGGLLYNRQVTSASGEILRYDTFILQVVLKPIEGTRYINPRGLFKENGLLSMKFSVLEYNFTSCAGFQEQEEPADLVGEEVTKK